MDCPHHGRQLVDTPHDEHSFHACKACSGHFVPKNVLQKTLRPGNSNATSPARYSALPPSSIRCPADHTPMRSLLFEGIEIDLCPECGGAWLDAGEYAALKRKQGDKASGGGASKQTNGQGSDSPFSAAIEFVAEAIPSVFDGL